MESRGLTIIAACSMAILLGAVGWHFGMKSQKPALREPLPIPTPTVFMNEVDTDKDGIPDWQEKLIGSDPSNADSDGDGVVDTLPEGIVFSTATTASAAVAERLVTDYLYLKDQQSYTPERGDLIASSLVQNLHVPFDFTPYTHADIITTDDTSNSTVLAYRKNIQNAVAPFLELEGAEFELYARFVDSGDTSYLDRLSAHAEVYESVARKILTTPVPKDAANIHLEVANGLSYFAATLRTLVLHKDDPIASFSLLRSYNEAEQYVHATFSLLNNYYNRGVRE